MTLGVTASTWGGGRWNLRNQMLASVSVRRTLMNTCDTKWESIAEISFF